MKTQAAADRQAGRQENRRKDNRRTGDPLVRFCGEGWKCDTDRLHSCRNSQLQFEVMEMISGLNIAKQSFD